LACGRVIHPTDDDPNWLGCSVKRWAEEVREPKESLSSVARIRGNRC
jgi:hypothetical protein